MNTVELVSPGGSPEKIKFAIEYGADAVYCGLKSFSLRSRAHNLTREQWKEVLRYVKGQGRKIYLTLNAYLFDRQMDELLELLEFLKNYPPDAFIVSDLGVLSVVRQVMDIPVHISTQANITNADAANLLSQFGVKRVVLAREMSLEDIRRFVKRSGVEAEVFIHGAMCMAYSGRCFMSAFMTGRSANSGDCAQSCRWRYRLVEEKRPGEVIEVEEHSEGSFIFNAYDLCALPFLDELIDTGVRAFKIEGRMKSVYYVGVTTAIYRRAIDDIRSGKDFRKRLEFYYSELEKVSHRPYSAGFYKGRAMQYVYSGSYIRNCCFCAVFDGLGDKARLHVRNRLTPGEYELFLPDATVMKLELSEFYDEQGNKKTVGNPNEFLYIKCHAGTKRGFLRRCVSWRENSSTKG